MIHSLSEKCDNKAFHKLFQRNIANETVLQYFNEYLKMFDKYIIKYGTYFKSKKIKSVPTYIQNPVKSLSM